MQILYQNIPYKVNSAVAEEEPSQQQAKKVLYCFHILLSLFVKMTAGIPLCLKHTYVQRICPSKNGGERKSRGSENRVGGFLPLSHHGACLLWHHAVSAISVLLFPCRRVRVSPPSAFENLAFATLGISLRRSRKASGRVGRTTSPSGLPSPLSSSFCPCGFVVSWLYD